MYGPTPDNKTEAEKERDRFALLAEKSIEASYTHSGVLASNALQRAEIYAQLARAYS